MRMKSKVQSRKRSKSRLNTFPFEIHLNPKYFNNKCTAFYLNHLRRGVPMSLHKLISKSINVITSGSLFEFLQFVVLIVRGNYLNY